MRSLHEVFRHPEKMELVELKAILVPLAVYLLATAGLQARSADISAIDARLGAVAQAYTPNDAFMGAVLVASGDDLLLDRGYGQADLEWGLPNTPDVKFRLGSLTKQFTATLVLLLQEDGKLNLSDRISQYISDAPKSWAGLTVAQLLGHISGIPAAVSPEPCHAMRRNISADVRSLGLP